MDIIFDRDLDVVKLVRANKHSETYTVGYITKGANSGYYKASFFISGSMASADNHADFVNTQYAHSHSLGMTLVLKFHYDYENGKLEFNMHNPFTFNSNIKNSDNTCPTVDMNIYHLDVFQIAHDLAVESHHMLMGFFHSNDYANSQWSIDSRKNAIEAKKRSLTAKYQVEMHDLNNQEENQ